MTTYESESAWTGESGFQEWETVGDGEGPWSGESYEDEGEFLGEGPYESEWESEEETEIQLAQELLEISDEEELEEFLGKLVKGAGKFLKSGVGKAVTGALRGVAKTALPMVGSALGSMVAPGLGTAIGGKLGSMASKLLEAEEAEMLGEAEAEYEAARRFVRFGRASARYAAMAPPNVPPQVVARTAVTTAARRYAPTLLRSSTPNWRTRRTTRYQRGRSYQPRRRPVRGTYYQPSYGYSPWAAQWPVGSGYGFDDDDAGSGWYGTGTEGYEFP